MPKILIVAPQPMTSRALSVKVHLVIGNRKFAQLRNILSANRAGETRFRSRRWPRVFSRSPSRDLHDRPSSNCIVFQLLMQGLSHQTAIKVSKARSRIEGAGAISSNALVLIVTVYLTKSLV
jgi:hypothetical protein